MYLCVAVSGACVVDTSLMYLSVAGILGLPDGVS